MAREWAGSREGQHREGRREQRVEGDDDTMAEGGDGAMGATVSCRRDVREGPSDMCDRLRGGGVDDTTKINRLV
jgi:hypothetical protein